MKYRLKIEEAKEIAEWYQKNKRQLPWRDTNNPYDVWLSEIMLQQTLPTIQDLVNCEDDALMRLWEGLGYYSRARNLKKCAIALVEHYISSCSESILSISTGSPLTCDDLLRYFLSSL